MNENWVNGWGPWIEEPLKEVSLSVPFDSALAYQDLREPCSIL